MMDIFVISMVMGVFTVLGLLTLALKSVWDHDLVRSLRFGGLTFIVLGLVSTAVFYKEWMDYERTDPFASFANDPTGWMLLPSWFLVLPFAIGLVMLASAGIVLAIRRGRRLWQNRLDRAALAPAEARVSHVNSID